MELQRILVKGGVLSPSELKQIITFAEMLGLKSISFGSRQDIILPIVEGQEEVMSQFPNINVESVKTEIYHNISCSYVASEILPTTSWVGSATYLYILEQFRNNTTLAVNITDPKQRLVPLFTGHLNFIASHIEDYWYLYIQLPSWEKQQVYPVLIYTWDIGKVTAMIEKYCTDSLKVLDIFNKVNQLVDSSNNRTIDKPLQIPYVMFPYYEGMNRTASSSTYWLGLYWRNNDYYLSFLKALCDLCLECKIGKICITSWKSFIVKGIQEKYKIKWEKLLGKFGINVRHSLLELNWHLPIASKPALELKQFIVRNFDQNDISTYGLTFGIGSSYRKHFTTIVIQENPKPTVIQGYSIRPTYNVLYANKFDPNTLQYHTYAQDIDKIELPGLLMELSRLYFEQLDENPKAHTPSVIEEEQSTPVLFEVYECPECQTIYDERYGNSWYDIPPQTSFNDLPNDYICPICETNKTAFLKKEISIV